MNIVFSQTVLKNHPLFIQISEITFNESIKNNPITSTGNCYLVFVYGNFIINNKTATHISPPKYYMTPIDNAYKLSAEKGSSFVAIRMNADRFKVISGLKTASYIDQLINLNTILPEEVCQNLWRDLKNNSFSDYENSINTHLKSYFSKWSKPSIITPILHYIRKQNGLLNVVDLLDKFHISHSTLNRYFKSFVGFNPNKYIRLIRFNYIIRLVESKSELLKNLLIDYKYYDYSHFTKDFKLFTGQTPKEFKGLNHELLKEILFKKVNF